MFKKLAEQLKANARTIVFTEGTDARILEAADKLTTEGILRVILLGKADEVKSAAKEAGFNIEKCQTVAIGDSVNECEKNYRQLMVDSGIVDETAAETPKESRQITGRIEKMVQTVLDGNSHFYILLEGQSRIFDVPLSDNADIVRYNTGDTVTFSYHENESLNEVTKVEAAQQTVQ